MRAIDIHAHLTPQCFQRAVLAGQEWHGMTRAEGELFNPMHCWQYSLYPGSIMP
jgi:aminocarboxymuconate-semialdehyde decarboxylase